MPDIEIVDRFGRRRRARKGEIPQDGERISIPHTMMDAASREVADHLAAKYGFTPKFADGTPDHTNPFAPGYRFADTDDPARLAAEEAYQERSRRMADAWKHKGNQPQDDNLSTVDKSPHTLTLDAARAAADAAYEARSKRMSEAWRNR